MEMLGKKAVIVAPFRVSEKRYDLAVNEYEYDEHNSLKFLQKAVKGSIEHLSLDSELYKYGIDSYINDEGKILDLEPSFLLIDRDGVIVDMIAGNVIFCAYENADNMGMEEWQLEIFYRWLEGLRVATVKSPEKKYVNKVYCIELPYSIADVKAQLRR